MPMPFPHGKLGKKAAVYDPNTPLFEHYVNHDKLAPAIVIPKVVDWAMKATAWPMRLNDQLGCCTISAKGNMIEEWSSNVGTKINVPDSAILKAYEDVGGYVPGDPSTDNGAVMLDVEKYFRDAGIGGHKILAFTALEPKSHLHVREAVYLFGAVDIGIQLPLSAQSQVGSVWTAVSGPDGQPGTWGGHDVPIVHYNPYYLYCVTWGRIQPMTWGFFDAYCDEVYALVSPDWVNTKGVDPSGFNLEQLIADQALVAG